MCFGAVLRLKGKNASRICQEGQGFRVVTDCAEGQRGRQGDLRRDIFRRPKGGWHIQGTAEEVPARPPQKWMNRVFA